MGEGVGAPDIRGARGVQEVEEERAGSGRNRGKFLQQANILQVKRGGNQECTVPEVRG